MAAVRLHHDETGVRVRPGRRQQQIDRHVRIAARLAQREAAEPVVHLVQMPHLVAHGGAGYARYAAGDHLADLAFGMGADDRQHLRPAHRRAPRAIVPA